MRTFDKIRAALGGGDRLLDAVIVFLYLALVLLLAVLA